MFLTKREILNLEMVRIPFDKEILDLEIIQNDILVRNIAQMEILYQVKSCTYVKLYNFYMLFFDARDAESLPNSSIRCYITKNLDIYLRYAVYEKDIEKVKNSLNNKN